MLYLAEGDKSKERERVKFSNSDPALVRVIMKWFRTVGEVPEEKFRICIHIHELFCRKKVEVYWSQITNVPLSQFYTTQIKPTSLGYRKNHLYNGTCSVSVGSKELFRRIMGWKAGFLEKFDKT